MKSALFHSGSTTVLGTVWTRELLDVGERITVAWYEFNDEYQFVDRIWLTTMAHLLTGASWRITNEVDNHGRNTVTMVPSLIKIEEVREEMTPSLSGMETSQSIADRCIEFLEEVLAKLGADPLAAAATSGTAKDWRRRIFLAVHEGRRSLAFQLMSDLPNKLLHLRPDREHLAIHLGMYLGQLRAILEASKV